MSSKQSPRKAQRRKKIRTGPTDLDLYIYYLFGQKAYLFDEVEHRIAVLFKEDDEEISDHSGYYTDLVDHGYLDMHLKISKKGTDRLHAIGWPMKMTWDLAIYNIKNQNLYLGERPIHSGPDIFSPLEPRQLKEYTLPDDIDRLEDDVALIGPILWPIDQRDDDIPIVVHLLTSVNQGVITSGIYDVTGSDWAATLDSAEWGGIYIDDF